MKKKTDNFEYKRIQIGNCSTPSIISPDGELIASAVMENFCHNAVKLLDIETEENKILLQDWFGHEKILTLAFSRDNKILAGAGVSKHIRIWDVKAGLEIDTSNTPCKHLYTIKSIEISSSGQLIASGDECGIIKFWNLITKQEIHSIKASSSPINLLAFSLDNQMLISGSDNCNVKFWNVKTGKEDYTIGQHSNRVNSVAFSPDRQIIAIAGNDYRIKLWELKSQTVISVLAGHTKKVTSVAFSPDSQTLVSGSKDCTIRIWQRR